ncbi:double-strand break repair protein AddB [Oricola sp.]|uniref:double-strand break repair protein AddB n=1 Tax=Oricola sp. TaxID=1979950 RepID=UPI0025FB01C7|nr:double-strand break repair protein AddB [Oricola sp.]MCI5077571.1 double-strand break repair protein AddB [Oricola sp.]
MAGYVHPRVFTIAPGIPFLPAVTHALCDGDLVPGFRFNGDPLQLPAVSIYVPTRRAAREMRSAFLDHLGGETILLPRIRPLGEFDEDAEFFVGDDASALEIPPAIDATERLLLLGTLIRQWTKHLKIDIGKLYGDERIATPVSTADAFWLARDLAGLMDEFSTGQVPVTEIAGLDTGELSEWWKVTLAFLEIMRREWPDILAERRVIDSGEHRNRRILAEATRLKRNPPTGPVIVAGSTGSIPATADLIATVARLPLGAVVLPGFDRTMDEPSRALLASDEDLASVIGHPQYGLQRLATVIGITPDSVEPVGELAPSLAARNLWVAESLRPSATTDRWMQTRATVTDAAFNDVALLVAPNEHWEAAAIAAALREAIRDPKATAALVTPDRNLARRVVGELARYGIDALDTGGTPAFSTQQGRLLQLVLEIVFNPGDPATLLALAKHPLVTLSAGPDDHADRVAQFEMAILRNGTGRVGPDALVALVVRRKAELARHKEGGTRVSSWLAALDDEDFARLTAFAACFETALAPLVELAGNAEEVAFDRLVEATVRVLEALARDADGFHDPLYEGEPGALLRGFLSGLVAAEAPLFLKPSEWPQAVGALMADMAVKPAPGGHPRISIWGALEARLQTVDLMILGGLNEGVWPSQTNNDQFLTRGMKAGLGLEPPERRIGLAAHDFQMALGQARVILSRSERAEGAPAIASRWWQRLTTFAGREAVDRMTAKGGLYLAFARAMEDGPTMPSAPRPAPTPPLASRPKSLSVTEVETLIRDPYAVYAKKVLRLKPIEELVRDPGAAERGSLFHAIFEHVVREHVDPLAPDALDRTLAIARHLFDAEDLPPDIRATWWPRVEAAAAEIKAWEADRAAGVAERHAEIVAAPTPVGQSGVVLTGRADRMDRRSDGSVDIIDFKTGTPPSARMVKALLAPQLPLEGALLLEGAFSEFGPANPAGMAYVHIDPKGRVREKNALKGDRSGDDVDPVDASQGAWQKLKDMLAYYGIETNGYQSQRMPQKVHDRPGDYDHLARTREWRVAGVDDDE